MCQQRITIVLLIITCLVNTIEVQAQITKIPMDATIQLNESATFICTASNMYAIAIAYVVTNVDPSNWASHAISQSAPIYEGSDITSNLTIVGSKENNKLKITCRVYLTAAEYVDIPPPAMLTVQAPPTFPQNLTATAMESTTSTSAYVVLTWSPPMDQGIGGSLYYNVSYQAVNGSHRATNTTDTNITVTNLYPGVTYMMTVEADNGVTGDESKRSVSINVTTKCTSPPSAPLNLTAAAVAGTYVNLTWSPPMDPGIGGPLYYNVSYQAVNGSHRATNTTDTNITVTNLYPGVTYMMTVEADNGGSGEESKRSASINVTTNSTSTYPTVSSPAPSNAWMVAVGIGVPVVVGVMVVIVVSICYKYMGHPPEVKKSPSTSKMTSFTTNDIPLSSAGKGEEKEISDTAIQIEKEEGNHISRSTKIC